jgi:RNA polymerase sigma factor (sigma-70 family)
MIYNAITKGFSGGLHMKGQDFSASEDDVLGYYLRDIRRVKPLTGPETTALYCRMRDEKGKFGEKAKKAAKERLINGNLRLVAAIVLKQAGRSLDMADLIQEGNLGLIRAVERFDPERGYQFNTFASPWIRSFVNRAITRQLRSIKLPEYMHKRTKRIREESLYLLGRNEKAEVHKIGERLSLTEAQVREARRAEWKVISLDAPLDREHTAPLRDFLPDTSWSRNYPDNPEAQFFNTLSIGDLHRTIGALPERYRLILRMRYGLDGYKTYTLEEIGKHLGICREAVRQLENRAVKKFCEMNLALSA